MPDLDFTALLQRIASRSLSIADLVNAAEAFSAEGQSDRALLIYKVWIEFNPENPHLYAVYFNYAVLLDKAGDAKAAEEAFRATIVANPDFMPAYINLGGLLERKGEPQEGIALWRTGIDRCVTQTGTAMAHKALMLKQLARVLLVCEQFAEAEAALLQCLELDPAQRDAAGQYLPLRLSQCKWPILPPSERPDKAAVLGGIQPLSLAAYTDDPMFMLAAAWRHVKLDVAEKLGAPGVDRRHAVLELENRRIRIGYVSSDLRDHAVGYLMAELFELHDRDQFEIFAYYCGIPSDGPLTQRTKAAVEHWVDIKDLSDDDAAARIAADGIDILVDVNGLTKDAKTAVFSRRPAPIQINWLGFPGTMGSPYHQYIIADDWIIPPENEIYYSEKVLRLPCYQSNDRKRVVDPVRPSRADAGLPEGAFVFCCFNGAQKITRFTFDRWIEILLATPNSVLWLMTTNIETNTRLADYAAERGVGRDRLIFAPKQPNAMHMARYPLADLFLDTSPYGAHTTASDALWMGVPVLTLSGRSFAARVCGSLVRAAGLPDLVCATPREFVEKAIALAKDRTVLQSYRDVLAAGRSTSTLFDMDKLVGSLQDLYRHVCAEHQAGRTPVPDLQNLDIYFDIGVEDDHERRVKLASPDYEAGYREKLAHRHRLRPIPADGRLWTVGDIAAADAGQSGGGDAAAHPLFRLSQLYDAASLILCQPLTKASEAQVDELLAETRSLVVHADEGSEVAMWEKHYRLIIEAVDLSALRHPSTFNAAEPKLALSTAGGAPLDWAGLQAAAEGLGAKAVFFAAADESYIDRYARLYIESILKHCDVPCMVVVHVIGGFDKLKAIIERLAIHDERLFFTSDDFDAEAVTTRCYDSPPKSLIPRPVAHFQSVRFLRLGRLLQTLKRPIFVSDIDLLLQRGVSDLLLKTAAADVVFNEHYQSANAGSRLTANLLLVNPTPKAAAFLKFLSSYLQSMLAKPEVTRWVDQFGLLMARHNMQRSGKKTNIQYFDTDLDINNIMYRSYQENPFRFLSLYHGFDMSSLEGGAPSPAANVAAE